MAAIEKNKFNCRSIGRLNKLFVNQASNQSKIDKNQKGFSSELQTDSRDTKIALCSPHAQVNTSQIGKSVGKTMEKSECSSATTAFTVANFQTKAAQRGVATRQQGQFRMFTR